LYRLKHRFIIAPMSNGNVALMTNMAKNGGLPWDCILGAELARHYKPDPESYLTAVQLLSLRPDQVMMVAAHQGDLLAAGKVGLQTAFVPRPLERGPGRIPDPTPDPSFTVVATDFMDLAVQLKSDGSPRLPGSTTLRWCVIMSMGALPTRVTAAPPRTSTAPGPTPSMAPLAAIRLAARGVTPLWCTPCPLAHVWAPTRQRLDPSVLCGASDPLSTLHGSCLLARRGTVGSPALGTATPERSPAAGRRR
jgi:hypothetical protein